MKGSVRKKGATWSYRIDLGVINGKRSQIERSGYKTKKEATAAMHEAIYNYNCTGDYVENKKITFEEVYNEFIEKEASATRAYATIVRYKSLYKNHLHPALGKYYVYQISASMINDFINEKSICYSEEYVKGFFKFLKFYLALHISGNIQRKISFQMLSLLPIRDM